MLTSNIVSLKLRDSYKLIAKDYLNKKSQPWEDYKSFKSLIVPKICLLYTSPSPRDVEESRMPSSA